MPLREDNIPTDDSGQPHLSYYTDSAKYYAELYGKFIASLHGGWPWDSYESNLPWSSRIHAIWGLIAKGSAAVPFALKMLQSPEPEAREDGASILSQLGQNESIVTAVLCALAAEEDTTARDSLILTLGEMRSRQAIPALSAIIRDESADGDTRWTAVESLGKIVRRRFLKQDRPIEAASKWLSKHDRSVT